MSKEISKEQTKSLLNCPFCGGEIKQMFLNPETYEDNVWDKSIGSVSTWFKCYACDSEFFHDEPIDTPEKQAEWWNTRIPMQNIVERLEEEKSVAGGHEIAVFGARCAYEIAIEIVKKEGELHE